MNKLNKSYSEKQNGFTLIELMVVLSIVSILAIGSLTLFKEQKVNFDQNLVEGKLENVKVALLRFIEKNNYLPCPDANVKENVDFGLENRTLNKVATIAAIPIVEGRPAQLATALSPFIPPVSGVPAQPARTVNVDKCTVNSGTVPFKEIGLSQADVTDAMHNLFHYAVTKGVSDANKVANCPENSACFFNRNTAPAFNSTTEPVSGRLGVDNLKLCAGTDCSGVNLLNDGLVVVLLAYNQNANNSVSGLSAGEQENRDGDQTFVKSQYVAHEGGAYFDDLLVFISGYEIKRNEIREFRENTVVNLNQQLDGNDLENMGDTLVGGVGTNVWTDDAIWDTTSQEFDFGVGAANQEIVLTYKTRAIGTWDQPGTPSSNVTSDTATVKSNGDLVKEYKYDHTDNTQTGRIEVTYADIANDPSNTRTHMVDYWDETTEVIITTDSEGKINLEFAVGTTANYETIDFTNIELVYYNTPPPIPNFPSVEPVSDIIQTEDL